MKFKYLALPLMICSATVSAEEYTSISEANYSEAEKSFGDVDQFDIGTTYYFAPKETLGPLKEFEYINKTSNLFAGYSYFEYDGDDEDTLAVGGEYFASNGFVVGGSAADFGDNDLYTASVGYLFSPNFLLSLESVKWEDRDADYFVNASYNHQLSGNDYIGFSFSTDDNFDSRTLSSKFFKELGGETWFTANASYTANDDFEDIWLVGTEYYFSKATSIFANYNKEETLGLGVSHFFNRNIAGNIAYTTNSDTDVDTFLLGVTVQL
ncbi:putative porin [Microbulbifer thermotolerans]|uniref:putative porin n=1 Tax=Microbulbifer thermotolerans TaxID=252514 RepID=UPI0008EDC87C|nr:putative porin [Microbulbifer thermotolerans]MCX2782860.1 putative porin [Microbulbifer thermotolerans]SFC15098.1 Putative general porin [Microbulbifer thermotolerans]